MSKTKAGADKQNSFTAEQMQQAFEMGAQTGAQIGGMAGRARGRQEGVAEGARLGERMAQARVRPSLCFHDLLERRTKCLNALAETDKIAAELGFDVDKLTTASEQASRFDLQHGAASDNVTTL